MPWNSTWPIVANSVKQNGPTGVQNTNYVKDTMGGVPLATNVAGTTDHFWDVSAGLNGHHRFVKLPNYNAVPLFDPVNIQNVIYARTKTVGESAAQQDTQPFCVNTTNVMQLLGIRAMALFEGRNSNGAATILYSHNVTSVTRTATGLYTAAYTANLPSVNYLFLGGAMRNDASADKDLYCVVQSAVAAGTTKALGSVAMLIQSDDSTKFNPLQAWFICFGG